MRFGLLAKLLTAFIFVSIILGSAGLVIMNGMNAVKTEYQETAMRYQKANALTSDAEVDVMRQINAVQGYLLTREQAQITHYEEADADLTRVVNELVQLQRIQADRDKAAKLLDLSAQYDEPVRALFALVQAGKLEEATRMASDNEALAQQMIQLSNELSATFAAKASDSEIAVNSLTQQAQLGGYGALAIGFVLALGLGILLARGITKPVRQVADVASRLAQGDLRVESLRETGRDEIADLARSINQMVAALRTLVDGVQQSTQTVTGAAAGLVEVSEQASQASEQAANAVSTVATGANRQAEMSGEVSQTMRQLQTTVAQLSEGAVQTSTEVQQAVESLVRMVGEIDTMSDHANLVATASIQAMGVATNGSEVVVQTAEGMERIRQAVAGTAEAIEELEQLSNRIGEITGVISGIADQTNLLALNAAIEAARAGEAGRGFAVVADEVRKLAERSAMSAREIADLISAIEAGTARAVVMMGTGTKEVETGSALARSAGEALQEILQVVDKTVQDVKGIATRATAVQSLAENVSRTFDSISAVAEENGAAAEEMAASAEQVLSSVSVITEVSQENAAVAEEVSASTEEVTASAAQVSSAAHDLKSIAASLQEQVAQFKL